MVRALDCIAVVFSSPAMQAMRRDEDEYERTIGGWNMDARDWVLNYSGIFYRQIEIFLERIYACTYSTAACD